MALKIKNILYRYISPSTNDSIDTEEALVEIKKTVMEAVGEDEKLPASAELEKIYEDSSGNISRIEIFEAEYEDIAGRNELRKEQRERLEKLFEK